RERRVHAAHRLRRAGQLPDVLRRGVRQRPELHGGQAEQHRQSGCAEGAPVSAGPSSTPPPSPEGAMPDAAAFTPEPALAQPESLSQLFWAFTWLALQGFGGVLAVAQRELVERLNWMTREEFVETLAV